MKKTTPLILLTLFLALYFLGKSIKDVNRLDGYEYIIDGVGYDLMNPLVKVEKDKFPNIENLNRIVVALYKYENEHNAFPLSAGNGTKWSSPVRDGKDWISHLVPDYIQSLPEDIDKRDKSNRNFLYRSDGVDFKLIAARPGDCELVKEQYREVVDPKRDCYAYGYWTRWGKNW